MTTTLAVIGGSQAYALLGEGAFAGERVAPVETPFGASQAVRRIALAGREALFMSRHGEEGYHTAAPWVNYRANIWALKELGAGAIVAWSGPGTIDPSLPIGSFVLPDDIIDETRSRPSSFFTGTGWGFVRQNPVFCPDLRNSIERAVRGLGLEVRVGGTYVCTEGPRLETPAEIRKFAQFGGHLVGMTLCPEVFLARELEMCYAPICYVTNYAEGLRDRPFKPGVLFEGLLDADERAAVADAVAQFPRIIEAIASQETPAPACHCANLMERYRRRGDIGEDWHGWMGDR